MTQKSLPVDVICVCGADGQLRPLRLRIPNSNGQSPRMEIVDVLRTDDISYIGAEARSFLCRGKLEEGECMVELWYAIRTHIWYLARKIY